MFMLNRKILIGGDLNGYKTDFLPCQRRTMIFQIERNFVTFLFIGHNLTSIWSIMTIY